LEPYEAFEQYVTVREELIKYSEKLGLKKEIICLTKIDAMSDEELQTFQSHFQEQLDKKVLPISSVSGRNLDKLKQLMLKTLEVKQEKE
jgi:GTP-binding protein